MKKKVLMLTYDSGSEKRNLIRQKCIDYWIDSGVELVIFHTEEKSLHKDAEMFLRESQSFVDGYNEMLKYLYQSDLDYALIVDDDTIFHEKSLLNGFDVFESNFESFDTMAPLLQNSAYNKLLEIGGFSNSYSYCTRMNFFKNLNKYFSINVFIDSKLKCYPDTEFGIQLIQNGVVMKKCASILEKDLGISSSTIKKDQSTYLEEKTYLSKKYGIKLMKFREGRYRLNIKSYAKSVNQSKLFKC